MSIFSDRLNLSRTAVEQDQIGQSAEALAAFSPAVLLKAPRQHLSHRGVVVLPLKALYFELAVG